MKNISLGLAVLLTLIGCSQEKETAPTKAAPAKAPAVDFGAGKALAERSCKNCHGLDGKGAGPAIPHLAAQRERYLAAALNEYKQGKRTHSALRELASKMSDTDIRNIAAYYAGQPPVAGSAAARTLLEKKS